ncbi:MAG: hypothetical protein Q9182_001724 [Xanthomendoza sp. 2 TL-2023]
MDPNNNDARHPVVNGNQAKPAQPKVSTLLGLNVLIVGAGARGNAYARAVTDSTNACVVAVADPIDQKRDALGRKYIWKSHPPSEGQSFSHWREFLDYEILRRKRGTDGESAGPGIDGVFICTLDEMHAEIIIGLAPLNLHLMSEKPLATTLEDCLKIYRSLQPPGSDSPSKVFSIGHVLHYSPHNILLRKLLLEDCVIASMGSLKYFKRSRKPGLAGDATNCLQCPAERKCMYSAKKIYQEKFLASANAGWPIHIVDPQIEDLFESKGMDWAAERLQTRLTEDYDNNTPQEEIERRPWFGRCVYESDNDVCDDQIVTMSWDDDPLPHGQHLSTTERLKGRGAKTAVFHMIGQTEKQCERRGRVYGTKGEIEYDSKTIRVYDFATSEAQVHHPHQPGGGHGGGDEGLTRQFIQAIAAVELEAMPVEEAQKLHIGCTLDDVIRSHAMVFAAEEARRDQKVLDWVAWWQEHVISARP